MHASPLHWESWGKGGVMRPPPPAAVPRFHCRPLPHPSFPGTLRKSDSASTLAPQPHPFPRLSLPPLTASSLSLLAPGPPQGAKIIQSFLWYLNPRQVFDLSQGGPKEA